MRCANSISTRFLSWRDRIFRQGDHVLRLAAKAQRLEDLESWDFGYSDVERFHHEIKHTLPTILRSWGCKGRGTAYLAAMVNDPPADFICADCRAHYKVVRVKAGSSSTDRLLHCKVCRLPIAARDGEEVLKYFLISRKELN